MTSLQDTPEETKSCCAATYSSDAVALLLGDSYHPGGPTLTRRLAAALALAPGEWVLDVASGRGTTALLLAQEHDVDVDGVDLSPANVTLATGAASAAGLIGRVRFTLGDAERLPFPDGVFDAVVCECAFCTFPDKRAAAAEMTRVLRPGGRLGITDVTADPALLPPALTSLAARVACIGDARPLEGYAALFTGAGLRVTLTERHDRAAARMVDQIEARLTMLRFTARAQAEALGLDFDQAAPVVAAAKAAVAEGLLGYGLIIAEKSG